MRQVQLLVKKITSSALYLLLASTAFANEIATTHEQQSYNYDMSKFIRWIEEASNEIEIPGVAMAIVSREGVSHLKTWGVKKAGEIEPVSSDSIFRIASMSKTFAGTAAALLVEEDLVSWDTLMSDMFPNMNLGTGASSHGITLKHIVSHSTGLMPHSYSNMLDDGVPYNKIKSRFNKIPTVCQPGDCYGYQNVVFSLTAEVVERSTGDSYEKYLEEHLFKPLGMVTASVGLDPYKTNPRSTAPHRKTKGGWRATTTNPAYYSVAPASGVNASIFDMTLWLRANLGAFPEVLPLQFLSELHTPIISTPRGNYFNRWQGLEKAYYATGWRVFDYQGIRAVHHGGGVRGYRSEMVIVPEANIGVILMFNAETTLANEVVPAFLDNLSLKISNPRGSN